MTHSLLSRRQVLAASMAAGALTTVGIRGAAAGARRQITVGMSASPKTLEPVIATDTAIRRVVPQIFDTLLAFDDARGMALRPALAERWERIDGRSLQLKLRQGVVFHDGNPFTAEDVAFSLGQEHVMGPGGAGATEARAILERVDRIEIVDPHTVIVHAKGDDALLEQRLAAWGSEIVCQRAFRAAGSWQAWAAALVGSGPYRFVGQKLDVNVVLEANDAYWGGPPPFSRIEYRIIPEMASRVNGLLAGEFDLITDLAPDQFAEIARHEKLEVAGGVVQNIRFLAVDQTDPVLKDPRVRRALSLALDRKLLIDALWEGRLPVPNGFQLPSYGKGYIENFPALAYDPDKARALLADAGYKGEPITYRLLSNYYPNQVSGAQVMVEMWRAVGLNVQIQMMENFAQIQRKPINAIYDTSTTALLLDHLGHPWRVFAPQGMQPMLLGIWRNEEYFALGAKLENTIEPDARRIIVRRMLTIIGEEDPPGIILHVSGQFYGKRKDLSWIPGQTLSLDFGPFNPGSIKS